MPPFRQKPVATIAARKITIYYEFNTNSQDVIHLNNESFSYTNPMKMSQISSLYPKASLLYQSYFYL